jgi:tetrahydromethanopterin S-methyltransferase subunit B
MDNSSLTNNNPDKQVNNLKKSKANPEQKLMKEVIGNAKKLKILEDRYLTIRKKTQLTDQNMLETNNRVNTEIKAINEELNKLKIKIEDMTEKLDQLITETKGLAKRNELMVLSKYLDYWKMFDFVTKEELERTLNDQ